MIKTIFFTERTFIAVLYGSIFDFENLEFLKIHFQVIHVLSLVPKDWQILFRPWAYEMEIRHLTPIQHTCITFSYDQSN